jgi:hypothetical protein
VMFLCAIGSTSVNIYVIDQQLSYLVKHAGWECGEVDFYWVSQPIHENVQLGGNIANHVVTQIMLCRLRRSSFS